MAALDDQKEFVRVQAAQAAGEISLLLAAPKLVGLLSDPSWWVRFRAAESLYNLGAPGEMLLETIAENQSIAGQSAAQLLGEMRTRP